MENNEMIEMTENEFALNFGIEMLHELGQTDPEFLHDMGEFNDLMTGVKPDKLIELGVSSERYGWQGSRFNFGDDFWCYTNNGDIMSIPDNLIGEYTVEQLTDMHNLDECIDFIEKNFDGDAEVIEFLKEIFKNS